MWHCSVCESVFDSIKSGTRLSLPLGIRYQDVFLEDKVLFEECCIVGRSLVFTGRLVLVTVIKVSYGSDSDFPIEITWNFPKQED